MSAVYQPLGVRAEAVPAWRLLSEALDHLADSGRQVPCQRNPDLWFSPDRAELADAAEACTWCPTRQLCAQFAVLNDERHGVWAGVDFSDRAAREAASSSIEGNL